jgi:hypothetical protein
MAATAAVAVAVAPVLTLLAASLYTSRAQEETTQEMRSLEATVAAAPAVMIQSHPGTQQKLTSASLS